MITISEIIKYLNLTGTQLSAPEKEQLISIFATSDTQNADGEEVSDSEGKKGDGFLNSTELKIFKELFFNSNICKYFQKINNLISKEELSYNISQTNNNDKTFNYFADNLEYQQKNFTTEALKKAFPDCIIDSIGNEIYVTNSDGENILYIDKSYSSEIVRFNIGEETVLLKYSVGKLVSKEYLSAKRTIYYQDGKKNEIYDDMSGLNYYLDKDENIVRVFDQYNNTDTCYENNQIKSFIDYNTGIKTEYLDNKIEKYYDGKALTVLSKEEGIDVEIVKSLPKEERIEFLTNFIINDDSWYKYNQEDVEKIYNIGFGLLEELGAYTKDLEDLLIIVEKELNNSNTDYETIREFSNSFRRHLLARIYSIEKPQKDNKIKDPNGSIDENFKQGNTGDCWLLATIKTIATKPKGEKLLNKLISVQKEGNEIKSVTVKIQGKNYVIPKEELYSAVEYSTGDLDIRAIEIAVNRYCLENGYKDITAGATVDFGLELFLGNAESIKEASKHTAEDFIQNTNAIDKTFIEELKTGNKVGVLGGVYKNSYAIDVETGEKIKLYQSHAYSISHCDEKFVYIINPHDSSKNLKIELEELQNIFIKGRLYNI